MTIPLLAWRRYIAPLRPLPPLKPSTEPTRSASPPYTMPSNIIDPTTTKLINI